LAQAAALIIAPILGGDISILNRSYFVNKSAGAEIAAPITEQFS
jgi:hypothetical protein